jgi:hypothetical protein
MSHPPMFGTFTITVDGSNDLCRGPDTLQQRHDSRKRFPSFRVPNHHLTLSRVPSYPHHGRHDDQLQRR